jgi:hypothetical protein
MINPNILKAMAIVSNVLLVIVTKLIANDTVKNVMANINFNIIKKMIPITNKTLDVLF